MMGLEFAWRNPHQNILRTLGKDFALYLLKVAGHTKHRILFFGLKEKMK